MISLSQQTIRRTVLFLAILISGGNLLIPRLAVLGSIFLLYFLFIRGHLVFKRQVAPLFILLALIFFVSLFHPYGIHLPSLITRFANFIAALLLLDIYLRGNLGDLKADLYAILKYMPLQAILTVVFALIAKFLFIKVSTDTAVFYTLFGLFNYHVMIEAANLVRPNGFFYEPGVFQLYLNMYLYLALFIYKNKKNVALSIVAIILTKSSTGIFVLLMILGLYLFKNYMTKGSLLLRIARFFIAITMFSGLLFIAWGNITDKLYGQSSGSFLARQYDTMTGVSVIAENPWLGIGFDHNNYISVASELGFTGSAYNKDGMRERHNTNGIVMMLYNLGLPLGTVFIFGLFRQSFFENRFLIGSAIFVSLLTETIVFTPFFLMLAFSGLIRVNYVK